MLPYAELHAHLCAVFGDDSLFGFSGIDDGLTMKTGCNCCLITLLPYPDLQYDYNAVEYFRMLRQLGAQHAGKINQVKRFLEDNGIKYTVPPASPKDDGEHKAEFSYKWAALHAGLGFIGKNDVFTHYKYAQQIRISCLLLDFNAPVFRGDISSKCGECKLCVQACPHGYISGRSWKADMKREELVDYKNCAAKSKHSGFGQKYLCAHCLLACKYPNS